MKAWKINNVSDLFIAKTQLFINNLNFEGAAYYLLLAATEFEDISGLKEFLTKVATDLNRKELKNLFNQIDREIQWLMSDVLKEDVQIVRLEEFVGYLSSIAKMKSIRFPFQGDHPGDLYKGKFNETLINVSYRKLCAAFDNRDWQEVIRLGGEMEALGYDEEVHPIEDRYKKAINAISVGLLKELGILLDNKEFDKAKEVFFKVSIFKLKSKETQEILQSYKQTATELYLNDKLRDFSTYGRKLISKLHYACKVTIKMFGEVVFERDLTNSDLFEFSGSFDHADSDLSEEIFKSEQIRVLIQKGKSEAKLNIILLNDQ